MGKVAKGTPGFNGTAAPVDWIDLKARIVAALDVAAEYEAFGVEFTKASAKPNGVRECRAVGREDVEPSAFVNVKTGVYHDSGGGGATLDFFNFALRHGGGKWGRWVEVIRHYAEKAGVEFGTVSYARGGAVVEAIHRYLDPGSDLVFGVHRLRLPNGDKTFRQYPWRDGQWLKAEGCMDGVPLFPYRLPALLAAPPDDPVWIVEGEKDVERAFALGLVATCNPMGARKWRDEFSEWLRGRPCYIIPDHDPDGRAHALKVATSLHGIAASVRVVELPGLCYHGDLSDWLDAGGTVEELGRLAHAAPEWAPPEPGKVADEADLDRDATVADLRGLASDVTWLWPLWIPGSALTLLASEAGIGKTRFCFDLGRRIFHGLPWPDGEGPTVPPGSKVLWVVADNQWQEMIDIPASFGIPDECVLINAPASDPYSGTSLETAEELLDFEARIRRTRPVLVVIDTITNTGDFKSQDSSDAKRQYKPLQEIANRCQVPIICVTHLNATGKVLGRRAVEKVRVVIQMEWPDPDGQPARRKLWVSKSKALRPDPLGVTMEDAGNEYDETPPEPPQGERPGAGARGPVPVKTNACMEWLRTRLLTMGRQRVSTIRHASDEAGYSAKTLYNSRDRLGVLESEEGGYKFWEIPGINGDRDGHDPPF